MSMCISIAQARTKRLCPSWLLLSRSCKSFMVHAWRSQWYMKILTEVLSRSLWEDVVKIPMNSCHRSLHDLVQVPEDVVKIWLTSSKRSLHDLAEILISSFLRGPCVILYRSLSEDLVEILVRSSPRGHWLKFLKILQMPCLRRACMKALLRCFWELLVSRFCEIISSSSMSFCDDLVKFS